MSSKSGDDVNPIPTEADIDNPSVVEDELKAEVAYGEDTEQLSDFSDDNDYLSVLSGSKYHFSRTLSSWYRRIAPLIRNKKVRILTVINFFLTLTALLLFLVILLLFILVLVMKRQVAMATPKDMPCLLEWGEWSACSGTCRIAMTVDPPTMRRQITRIFNASGRYAPCPKGLEVGFQQTAPCNVQLCPERLSSHKWSRCFYHIPHIGKSAGCYKIRQLATYDALIEVDVVDLVRNCSDEECPEFMA